MSLALHFVMDELHLDNAVSSLQGRAEKITAIQTKLESVSKERWHNYHNKVKYIGEYIDIYPFLLPSLNSLNYNM